MKKVHREVIAFLRDEGATEITMEFGKHIKLRYIYQGLACLQTTAISPSDFRFLDQFRKDFRREVRRQYEKAKEAQEKATLTVVTQSDAGATSRSGRAYAMAHQKRRVHH